MGRKIELSYSRVKIDYKKCLFSINSIILIVATLLLTCLNYYFSYATKIELIGQLSSPAEDLNVSLLETWIESYNGFEFFFEYYDLSDEFILFVLVLLAWIGIFVVGTFGQFRETGYGNLLVARSGYKPFFKNFVVSRSLYIASLLAIITVVQLAVAFILGGVGSLIYESGLYTYDFLSCMLIIFLQYLLISFYSIAIFIISVSLSAFIRNNYVLRIFPVMAFGIMMMLVFSTLGNIFTWLEPLLDIFAPFYYMTKLMIIINSHDLNDCVSVVVSVVIFAVASVVMYRLNIKKMESDYL